MEPALEVRVPGAVPGAPVIPSKSAASWSAIIAGALVAAAVSLILLVLGSGLGFSAVSPWNGHGISVTTFAVTSAIWLIVMQWVSSAAGGYIAGRLRTRWIGTDPHEVFFRDTAHGFVTWALATVLMAAVVVSSLSAALDGVHGAAGIAADAGQEIGFAASPNYVYGMDRLFRPSAAGVPPAPGRADLGAEATHIFAHAVATNGTVSDADQTYLADLVAARTGVSAVEAKTRVADFITAANEVKDSVKAAADTARKAAAKTAIFGALALVIGAFISCLAAALGGKLRDEHP